jgi:arylsulfatase A-like enzyme
MFPRFNSIQTPSTRSLYFRFWDQAAIRRGKWKYLFVGAGQRFLFDLESDQHERKNLIEDHPQLSQSLHEELATWCDELTPPGLPGGEKRREQGWYDFYFPQP